MPLLFLKYMQSNVVQAQCFPAYGSPCIIPAVEIISVGPRIIIVAAMEEGIDPVDGGSRRVVSVQQLASPF